MQLDPLSSSFGDSLALSNHVSKSKKKRSRQWKLSKRGKPLASGYHVDGISLDFGHHVGDNTLASARHARGIT